jgi:lysozyme family protein
MVKKNFQNIALIFIAVLIYFRMKKEEFIKKFIKHIEAWEGGLSSSKSDNSYKYGVAPGTDYHTNKGVTWNTYFNYCKEYDKTATTKQFLEMPYDIWYKIFKYQFFDYWNFKELSTLNFKLCCFIVEISWQSSPMGAEKFFAKYLRLKGFKDSDITPKEIPNYFVDLILDGKFSMNNLIDYRKEYIKSFKTYSKHGKGWNNRLEAFRKL